MATPSGSSFAPAFRLLPGPERHALAALHRFCRAADEAVDAADSAAAAATRLERWRAEVRALFGEGVPGTGEGRDLAPHVARYALARSDFERMLEALALDVSGPSFETEADLVRYCEGVASSPGYLALAIFGCPEARPYAHRLGLALQSTNVLRDAREDLRRGRLYFPREDLRRAGLTPPALLAQARDDSPAGEPVRRLVALQLSRARSWFGEAERAYRAQTPAARRRLAAARAMERLYRVLLRCLERAEPLPRARVRPGRIRALAAVGAAWIEARVPIG